ncbi:sensor histidine kinase [Christensenellaceae bacterium OttesenSCG-928-K19]|nr:sensor histidine kinase [Christensenellaceae bacterium OttesenSCG-928-K19]
MNKLVYKFNSIPIRRKTILFFILLVLIVALLSSVLNYSFTTDFITKELSTQLYSTLSKIDDNVSQSMDSVNQVSNAIYSNSIILDYLNAGFASVAESQQEAEIPSSLLSAIMSSNSNLSSIYIARPGAVSLHQGQIFDYAWESIKLSSVYDIAYAANGDAAWINDYYITSHLLTENNRIICNARLFYGADNEPYAISLVNMKESVLTAALTVDNRDSGSTYLIMDSAGKPIVHSEHSFLNVYTERLPFVDQILSDHDSFLFTINETDYLVNWVPSNILDWYIVSFTPLDYIQANAFNAMTNAIIVFAISMVLAAFLSFVFSKNLTGSIMELSTLFNKIEQGDFTVRATIKGNDEINQLAQQFNSMLGQLQNTVKALSDEQIEKQMIEINALQEQINPHFLYNTLESINSLAIIKGYTDISRLVLALSRMLRLSVNKGQLHLTLSQEVEHVQNYLYIQNIRHDNKFTLRYRIAPELENYPVIKLLFQPLVENSILHGFESKETNCVMYIRAVLKDDRVVIAVVDNGSGIDDDTLENINDILQNGKKPSRRIYGIFNINQRIHLHYGNEYGLRYESAYGHYTKITITLPYTKPQLKDGEPNV